MKFIDNGKDIIFIHIPRTAGTYIEKLLCNKYNINLDWPHGPKENLFGLEKINETNYYTLQHLTIKEMINNNFINI